MATSLKKAEDASASAETLFRSAFDRLKSDKPDFLPPGTPVSQANVAREAGCDPSALRKSRYPELISDIQRWQRDHPSKREPSARALAREEREERHKLKSRIKEIEKQRDNVASLLLEADTKIVELTLELSDLKSKIESAGLAVDASNVTPFPAPALGKGKP